MKIHLAKSAGFCFGVERALRIARQTAGAYPNAYMLGDIVHNGDVVREIRKLGIKKIDRLAKAKKRILIIRAHGTGSQTYARAKKFGYHIIDATCPMVKEIHNIAKTWQGRGYKIIVIGDKRHDEVQGIVGQLDSKAMVIDAVNNIPLKQLKKIERAAVVVQSTQELAQVLKIVAVLKKQIKQLKFFNTVCNPTRKKQEEIKLLPRQNDIVLIIGSHASANTKRLYQISKALNQRTYWVQSPKDLRRQWFKGVNSVGVSAGASTPDATTSAVINHIRNYS